MSMVHCTKDDPWKPEKGTPVHHHGAHEVGEQRDAKARARAAPL